MKFYINIINFTVIYQLWILLLSITKSYAEDTNIKTIQILTEKPDDISISLWNDQYTQLRDFFLKNNPTQNFDIKFSYNNDEPANKISTSDYENYVKYVISELQSSNYDIFILDGRFLFSDVAFIESGYVSDTFETRKFHQYYLELNKYINKEDLIYHHPKVLEDGYLNGQLYGLPFELDFDLLYHYHHTSDHSNRTRSDLNDLSWDQLLSTDNTEQYPLCMALGDEDELLNLFVEYIFINKGISLDLSENGKDFALFYNNTSEALFNDFRNFLAKAISSSGSESDLSPSLELTLENAYNAFIQKRECKFFKGKASHYNTIMAQNSMTTNDANSSETHSFAVSAELLPHHTSILDKKYLVINKNSKIEKETLISIASQLTSKETQLFKAQQFGSIPTFDMSQSETDTQIADFLTKIDLPVLELFSHLNPIHIKDVFNTGKYAAPFMEIRLLLPSIIKNYLLKKINYLAVANVFENIQNLMMDKMSNVNIPMIVLYIPMILFSIGAILVMILVYRYRSHPHLKIFSPNFCNLIIVGIIMNILSIPTMIQYHSIHKCQFRYVYETIDTSLIIFPMVAITYRIYSIYTNQSNLNIGKKLRNRPLFSYIVAVLIFMILILTGITFFILKFYMVSYGSIDTYRHPTCSYDHGLVYDILERILYTLLVIYMFILIVKTGKISKKFGEFKYIYVMIFILIVEGLKELFIYKLPSKGYFGYFVILFFLYMIGYMLCIYILVGSRLIFVIRHPNDPGNGSKSGLIPGFISDSLGAENYIYKNYINTKYIDTTTSGGDYFPSPDNENENENENNRNNGLKPSFSPILSSPNKVFSFSNIVSNTDANSDVCSSYNSKKSFINSSSNLNSTATSTTIIGSFDGDGFYYNDSNNIFNNINKNDY